MAVLTDLPSGALLCLLNHVVAVSNTGQLLKLAAACKQYLELIAHADWFWQQQSAALGWIRTGFEHPPRTDPPASSPLLHKHQHPSAMLPPAAAPAGCCLQHSAVAKAQHDTAAASPVMQLLPAGVAAVTLSRLWFQYYCLRMSCRWRLRLLMRKYTPFLNIQSRLAMQAGASIQELEAAEAALGMKLPWELWELYRFRAGQAPGIGVCFTEGCRYLGVHELSVVALSVPNQPSLAPERPPTQQQQLAAVEARLPVLTCLPSHLHNAHSQLQSCHTPDSNNSNSSSNSTEGGSRTAQAAAGAAGEGIHAGGCVEDLRGVVFLSNTMGSVEYAVAHDSAVYLKRGFTSRRVARNLTGFMQHLLA